MIYLLTLLYTFILIYKYDIKQQKRGFKLNYIILLIISCSIAGFSYRLGIDTVGYMVFFKSVNTDTSYMISHLTEYRYEPVFMILLSICKNIWDDFALVQIIVAIFVNTTIFWFLRKHSPYFYIAILFYFIIQYWNLNFEIKRESIAIALFLIAIDKLLGNKIGKKQYFQYYLICFFTLFCHRFAFLTLFYPLFTKIKLNQLTVLIIFVLSILALLKINYITSILSRISILSALFEVQNAIQYYTQSDEYANNNISIVGLTTSVIIPLIMMYLVRQNVDKRIMGLAVGYLVIRLIMSEIFIFYRLTNYLCFFLFIVFSYYAKYALHKKYCKGIYLSPLVGVFLLLLIGKCNKSQHIRYLPYNSIFIKEYNKERESEYYKLGDAINID